MLLPAVFNDPHLLEEPTVAQCFPPQVPLYLSPILEECLSTLCLSVFMRQTELLITVPCIHRVILKISLELAT